LKTGRQGGRERPNHDGSVRIVRARGRKRRMRRESEKKLFGRAERKR
jgi:hypothetical protein